MPSCDHNDLVTNRVDCAGEQGCFATYWIVFLPTIDSFISFSREFDLRETVKFVSHTLDHLPPIYGAELALSWVEGDYVVCEEKAADIIDDNANTKTDCPDCKGSGTYKGFMKVEDCTRCEGAGEVSV